MIADTEVEDQGPATNEYGVSDQELADARSEAKKLIQGDLEPEEKVEVEKPEPVEKPAADKKQKKEQPADPDILSFIPEDQREKYASVLKADQDRVKRLEHQLKSEAGRQSALQKKVEETSREKERLEALVAAKEKTPPKKLSELSERFKEVQEADPELGNSFEELREQIRNEMREEMEERFTSELSPIRQDREQQQQQQQNRARDEFTNKLDETVSNWREIVYAHGEDGNIIYNEAGVPLFSHQWAEFIQDQPPAFQKAYTNVSNADDALRAIEDHVQWGVKKGHFSAPENERTVPNADAIAAKRTNDLKRTTVPSGVKVPLQSGRDDSGTDEDSIARLRALARRAIKEGDPSIYRNQR